MPHTADSTSINYIVLVEDIQLCLKYINKLKLTMYSVWHNYTFILLLLFYYWLLVSASKGYHQADIYKKLKMLVHIVQKCQFYGIPFTLIRSLYTYYQPLDVLSKLLPAFRCVICRKLCWDFYIVSTMDVFPKIFFHWLTTLNSKIINNFKIFHMMYIRCYEGCKYI
jgi:hypothetical protein